MRGIAVFSVSLFYLGAFASPLQAKQSEQADSQAYQMLVQSAAPAQRAEVGMAPPAVPFPVLGDQRSSGALSQETAQTFVSTPMGAPPEAREEPLVSVAPPEPPSEPPPVVVPPSEPPPDNTPPPKFIGPPIEVMVCNGVK
jgi:hypothetical protein